MLGLTLGGYFGGDWARALPGDEIRVASVHYVLDERQPARVAALKLELEQNAREVQVRLGKGSWIRCAVAVRRARCRIPTAQGRVVALDRLSVFVRA